MAGEVSGAVGAVGVAGDPCGGGDGAMAAAADHGCWLGQVLNDGSGEAKKLLLLKKSADTKIEITLGAAWPSRNPLSLKGYRGCLLYTSDAADEAYDV